MKSGRNWRKMTVSLLTITLLTLAALPAAGSTRATDVRIGGTRVGAFKTVLDHDEASGNLFAVVAWESEGWSVNMSTNGGSSWNETYSWISSTSVSDLDAVVVGGYLYIGYVPGSSSTSRMRRCSVATGIVDSAYGFQTILDASPNLIDEIALASNADGTDSRVYYFSGQSNGTIRYHYINAESGEIILESFSLGGFAAGLDASYNEDGSTAVFFISFVGLDGAVHAAGFWGNWTNHVIAPVYSGTDDMRTAVSAHADTVICVYGNSYTMGHGIQAQVSNSGGASWSPMTIADPQVGGTPFFIPDVSARGGDGMAVVYQNEVGEPDPLMVQVRTEYVGGTWEEETQINDNDVVTSTWTTINRIPPRGSTAGAYSFGVLYLNDRDAMHPYFDRIEGLPSAGDNCGDPLEITLPAALPYEDDNTTCGRGDDYETTCMGDYDNGEDALYRLTVTEEVTVDIKLTASAVTYPQWAAIAVFSGCPDEDPDSCIATALSDSNPDRIQDLTLAPGIYYLMIDSYPFVACIDFNLLIVPHCDEECPPGAVDEGELCGNDTNGGCDSGTGFTTIECGQTVCGDSWGTTLSYDGDWYEVVTSEPMALTWSVTADFHVYTGLVRSTVPGSDDCADLVGDMSPNAVAGACSTASVTTDILPPGTHWFKVRRSWSAVDYDCNDNNDYTATLTCVPAAAVSAELTCIPSSGTVPFGSAFTVTMTNLDTSFYRRVAGRIDITTAGGGNYGSWRAGYTNLSPGESFTAGWNQQIPALAAVIGSNLFTLRVEDVTPAPYNQPPYPPAGATASDYCQVTGNSP